VLVATGPGQAFSPDADERLARFADLVGLAVSHADARARLAAQAVTDPLTGLANHRAFHEHLRAECRRALRHGRTLSLVLIDLDHFKQINDALGHQAGDRVISQAAERLASCARPGDLVARIGGDEFAWILPETGGMGGFSAAERARRLLAERPFADVGLVSFSAGVCDLAQASDADELVRLADGALYWAKAHGRDATYLYSPDVVEELSAAERAQRLARHQALSGLRALARAVDAKDPLTFQHSERVADMAERLARMMGWPEERRAQLHEAGLLHDVGKIGVPDAVLFKPGRLTPEEFELVKLHAPLGAQIAAEVLTDEQIRWIGDHHERWDGGGYPGGRSGADISQGGRILALADAWDVMTSLRSYKPPLSESAALAECRREAGAQFDADLIDALQAALVEAVAPNGASSSRG
jgi:diguanylate cyclase (GGDEF)-like protein